MEPIPFHVPSLDQADVPGVLEVLRDGWITTGPRCRAFESEFARMLGGDVHCIAVNSATAALHLALEALGVGPGDRVLTTPFTFTATAEVVRYLGADPVFADVDEATFNLTASGCEGALAQQPSDVVERIKVLLPVHYGGLPCAMEELEALAR